MKINNKEPLLNINSKKITVNKKENNMRKVMTIPKRVYFELDIDNQEVEGIKSNLVDLNGILNEELNIETNQKTYKLSYVVDVLEEEEEAISNLEDIMIQDLAIISDKIEKEKEKKENKNQFIEFPTEIEFESEVIELEANDPIDILDVEAMFKENKKEK